MLSWWPTCLRNCMPGGERRYLVVTDDFDRCGSRYIQIVVQKKKQDHR